MKVFVTGATGFVGQHVVPALLAKGHEITVVSRNAHKASRYPWFKDTNYREGDIYCNSVLAEIGQQDALLHLAWSGLPNYNALFHFEDNLPKDYRFIKSVVEAGVGQVLVTGTCLEYGLQQGCLTEDLPTQPVTAYALAKDCLRRFLQALQKQVPFNLQWARLFYLYGQGQNPHSLLAQLDQAIERGDCEFNMSAGEQIRDYLPVERVAALLTGLLEHREYDGIVNVCSGKPVAIRSLVEGHLAQKNASLRLNLGHYAYPDYEPMAFWGSTRKLTESLGLAE